MCLNVLRSWGEKAAWKESGTPTLPLQRLQASVGAFDLCPQGLGLPRREGDRKEEGMSGNVNLKKWCWVTRPIRKCISAELPGPGDPRERGGGGEGGTDGPWLLGQGRRSALARSAVWNAGPAWPDPPFYFLVFQRNKESVTYIISSDF